MENETILLVDNNECFQNMLIVVFGNLDIDHRIQ